VAIGASLSRSVVVLALLILVMGGGYGENGTSAALPNEWLGWVYWPQGSVDKAIAQTEKALAAGMTGEGVGRIRRIASPGMPI
jgi:hypothetical protein